MSTAGTTPNATVTGATTTGATTGATTAGATTTTGATTVTTGSLTGTVTTATTSGTSPGDQARSVFVNGILLTERTLMPDSTWPADLILDRSKSNWEDWSLRLSYVVDRQAFTEWLNGSIPCPDPAIHTRGAQIWNINDRALRAFILERVSRIDLDFV